MSAGPQPLHPSDGLPRNRLLGRAIQVSSAIGVAVGLICMVLVPIMALRFADWGDASLESVSAEAGLAAASMHEVARILEGAARTLRAAQVSLREVNGSLAETGPLLDAAAVLVGEQAPVIISDTRSALSASEAGAAAIDQVLRALALLGPITGVTYSPNQPLDQGLSSVAASLEPLPKTLRQVGDELREAASGLQTIGGSLDRVQVEMGVFAEDISGRSEVFSDLADDLDDLAWQAERARGSLGLLAAVGAISFELLLIGFALGQAAIFYVGRAMIPR